MDKQFSVRVSSEKIVGEILDDLQRSMNRAAVLFKTKEQAMSELFIPMGNEAAERAGLAEQVKPQEAEERFVLVEQVKPQEAEDGERVPQDLLKITGRNWIETIREIHANPSIKINVGDYMYIRVDVPSCTIDDVEFETLTFAGKAVCVDLIAASSDHPYPVFQFEDIVMWNKILSFMDKEPGCFKGSVLNRYLNTKFVEAFYGAQDVFMPNLDSDKISIPTATEVFGTHDEFFNSCNYLYTAHARQFEFYKKKTNCVKKYDGVVYSWWTRTVSGSKDLYFRVDTDGAFGTGEPRCNLGVSPIFCIQR
jgi:hypothetical protein